MMRLNRQVGVGLVVIGVILLLARLTDVSFGEFGWPFFILIPGLILLAAAFGGRGVATLAVPGSIVTTIGLINFVQNATDSFETWAYAWALVVAAAGVGQYLQGYLTNNEGLKSRGAHTTWLGLLFFACFGVFFELFIFGGLGGGFVSRYLLPVLLVIAGVVLLWRQGVSGEVRTDRE